MPSVPPCIRQRAFPLTAGCRHGVPRRVRAWHRGAWFKRDGSRCFGRMASFLQFRCRPPPPESRIHAAVDLNGSLIGDLLGHDAVGGCLAGQAPAHSVRIWSSRNSRSAAARRLSSVGASLALSGDRATIAGPAAPPVQSVYRSARHCDRCASPAGRWHGNGRLGQGNGHKEHRSDARRQLQGGAIVVRTHFSQVRIALSKIGQHGYPPHRSDML
jgi:hypothetical protein